MDWSATHFDWNRARAFLVTAEEGSLSAAGRALGMAQPTVGRQVAALEKELGVVLFDRVGKQLRLTPSGLELVDHVRQMFEAATRVSMAASGQSRQLDGEVCITAIDSIAALCLPPMIRQARRQYPGISIEILASNELSNLGRREADIAVRNVRPSHPDLVAKKVCNVAARLYGSRDYLDGLGRPLTTEVLNKADFTGFNRGGEMIDALRVFGLTLTAENFPVICENHLVQWQMVRQGVALGLMMEVIGDKDPQMIRVLPDTEAITFPIWLVAHQQLKSSKRIRAIFDLLSDSLAELAAT
ncbi:LysR family transcriptional regulator [Granulosicoccus sp. 3-233]|uniref:LysR family transcriptional regulator n=1 Tax=Granulosicoccus sp. 3-233 TaxID=3417969 RepID=UPI003D32EB8B